MTLRANELRIGNIVDTINRRHEVHLPSNHPKKIGAIGLFDVDLYDIDKPFAQQHPIKVKISDLIGVPLTEEFLLKKANWRGYKCLYFNVNFCLDTMKHLYYHGDYTGVNVPFIHSLQNLYFDINGEELPLANHPL